jgi:hypothetical protein
MHFSLSELGEHVDGIATELFNAKTGEELAREGEKLRDLCENINFSDLEVGRFKALSNAKKIEDFREFLLRCKKQIDQDPEFIVVFFELMIKYKDLHDKFSVFIEKFSEYIERQKERRSTSDPAQCS